MSLQVMAGTVVPLIVGRWGKETGKDSGTFPGSFADRHRMFGGCPLSPVPLWSM